MTVRTIGNPDAKIILVQALEQRGLDRIEEQMTKIQLYTQADFGMIAVGVTDWNRELSPWEAPPVFGKEGFGGEARILLERILPLLEDASKTYYIGGYSLAGLFALWSCYQTDRFAGVAAASPSVWFPDLDVYMKNNRPRCGAVYLSLGDREEKTKNRVMATVGDRIREGYQLLKDQGIDTVLEWNEGNHFRDADLRVAKAFAWLINK
ncbi:MAG: esterase [Lachnospiraceae bacterium]|nr:esterase [Lachnospiraceae bacterium]